MDWDFAPYREMNQDKYRRIKLCLDLVSSGPRREIRFSSYTSRIERVEGLNPITWRDSHTTLALESTVELKVDDCNLTCGSRALAAEAEGIRAMSVAKINTILIIVWKFLCNLRYHCEYSLLLEFMFVNCASSETGFKARPGDGEQHDTTFFII
jgi:hypothetical protein